LKVFEAVKDRRSIRNFQKREIPDDLMGRLIESMIWAPSAGNLQSRKFYCVKELSIKEALSDAALSQTFIRAAPLVVVGCTDSMIGNRYGMRGVELYTIQDVACSLMCMMLVAHETGLGTVWVGAFHEDKVAKVLDLPTNLRPVALVPVGWPEKMPHAPGRVKPEDAVVWV
jgi:nitroreductase